MVVLVTGLFILGIAGMTNAALTTIGTGPENYNLIWDNDNNGNQNNNYKNNNEYGLAVRSG